MFAYSNSAARRVAMKQFIIGFAMFGCLLFGSLSFVGVAGAQEISVKPMKLVLARNSSIPIVDVMKNLSEKCPTVTITTNAERSDYMLYAGGWAGEYRFMVIAKGGDTLYATKTSFLGNAVKDVCHFLSKQP